MNKREELLAETIGDHAGAEFARLAAAQVRRRRARRQLGVGLAGLLATLAFLSRPPPPAPVIEPLVVGPHAPAVEIMSDQELLAQLQGQPVLILKSDTRITGVIFLESGTKL